MWDGWVFLEAPLMLLMFWLPYPYRISHAVFNKCGRIQLSLYQSQSPEINRGTLAHIDEIRVSSRNQRRGVGRWAIENSLKSNLLAVSTVTVSVLDNFWHPQSTAHFSSSKLLLSMLVHILISSPRSKLLSHSGVRLDSVGLLEPGSLAMLVTQITRWACSHRCLTSFTRLYVLYHC